MKNIEFNYLYRDAYNYKNKGCVIFAPSLKTEFIDELHDAINLLMEKEDFIILKKLEKEIKNILDTDEYFIINYEIDIPELFFDNHEPDGNEYDHNYHEFDYLDFTDEEVTDYQNRNIDEFIDVLKRNSKLWRGNINC